MFLNLWDTQTIGIRTNCSHPSSISSFCNKIFFKNLSQWTLFCNGLNKGGFQWYLYVELRFLKVHNYAHSWIRTHKIRNLLVFFYEKYYFSILYTNKKTLHWNQPFKLKKKKMENFGALKIFITKLRIQFFALE